MSAHQPAPESLQSAPSSTTDATITSTAPATDTAAARFSPEEEATLLSESHALKTQATALYTAGQYSQAVGGYDKALASCPTYFEYEVAVLKANVAACHLQLQEWKEAVEAATAALDALERLLPTKDRKKTGSNAKREKNSLQQGKKDENAEGKDDEGLEEKVHDNDNDDDNDGDDYQDVGNTNTVVELKGDTENDTEQALKNLQTRDEHHTAVQKLRAKALLRRAKAKSELGGWGNLQGAEDDYKLLCLPPTPSPSPSSAASTSSSVHVLSTHLSPTDRAHAQRALAALPARIQTARDAEMGEMMGKLKELGNGILKPFGLSTDMFQMKKDEGSGGWSVNVNQGS